MSKSIYSAKNDPVFQKYYIDAEEQRTRAVAGKEIPFLYVHGGYREKGVKFIFCIPEKDSFKGRFFQYMSPFPGPDEEVASLGKTGEDDEIGFALINGAAFVESNMGSKAAFGGASDPHLLWKSSAAVAEGFRRFVMERYGVSRPFGYVYGGSGGGYKTMACVENTDAWDGAIPFVIGSPVSLPNTITMHAQGQRVLRHAFSKIVDNADVGSGVDLYDGLNEHESFMLRELTQMGFPPLAWYPEANGFINDGSLPVLAPGVKMADPGFFDDFWTVPGYLGADPDSSEVKDRLQFRGKVKAVHVPGAEETAEEEAEIEARNGVDTAWKKMLTDGKDAWIELETLPEGDDLYLKGVNITFVTGEAAGKQLLLGDMERDKETGGGFLSIGMCYGMDDLPGVLSKVKPGDELTLDNSDYIAIQSYYRHQVPADLSFHAWDQFRNADGSPALPQRANVMGYAFTGTGTVQDGEIQCKVMVIQSLLDESTCPWCADWYRETVRKAQGGEENFRLYYMDHCMHGNVSWLENTMVTNYMGALHQLLLDLSDWVEGRSEPLPTTSYEHKDGQIVPAATAAERGGIQCVPELLANGEACAHVKVGEPVRFTAKVTVPAGAGSVTAIDCSFDDDWAILEGQKPAGLFPVSGALKSREENGLAIGETEYTHSYTTPGTHFAAIRAAADRHGDSDALFTQVKNIARVRIVVEE